MRKKLYKKGAAVVLMLIVLSTGFVANAQESYTVKEGDYLKKIAQSVYGDAARWEEIYEANRDTVKNPNILYKGQALILPDSNPAPGTDQNERVMEDTVMTLEQWSASEECMTLEAVINEIVSEIGIIVEIKADGNKLLFVYHFIPELWGDLTAEDMADAFAASDDYEAMTGEAGELVRELGQEFDLVYGIKMDGVRYVFAAPDGMPFYTIDFAGE